MIHGLALRKQKQADQSPGQLMLHSENLFHTTNRKTRVRREVSEEEEKQRVRKFYIAQVPLIEGLIEE